MRMTRVPLLLLAMAAAAGAAPVTDAWIRSQTARIGKIAAQETPAMAVSTLLETAWVVQPYVPTEARRLVRLAAARAAAHPEIQPSSADVRRWMEIDPAGGEAGLRKLTDRHRVLVALVSYYRFKDLTGPASAAAAEAIRTKPDDPFADSSVWRWLAFSRPREAVELLSQAAGRAGVNRFRMMDSVTELFEGLVEAAEKEPAEVTAVLPKLRETVTPAGFLADGILVVPVEFNLGEGRTVSAKSNRETISALLDLLDNFKPGNRPPDISKDFVEPGHSPGERPAPPVDGSLPLADAMESIRTSRAPKLQVAELWRYLMSKPRSEEEARPIVEKLIEWAYSVPGQRDPFWFLYSLLNLDGRLPLWKLPDGLRPAIFQAAARLAPVARPRELLELLVEGMRVEKVEAPGDAPSALARLHLAELAASLESRYEFSLPALDGGTRTLASARGKVAVINFWATWCGPCRQELPILSAAAERPDVDVMAITDEPAARTRGFVDRFPVGRVAILRDEPRKTFAHYRVRGLPHTVVLDRSGSLVRRFTVPLTGAALDLAIAQAAAQGAQRP